MLKLRPHHISLLKNFRFNDKEYLTYFDMIYSIQDRQRTEALAKELQNKPNELVEIVKGFDDICDQCSMLKVCQDKKYHILHKRSQIAASKVFEEEMVFGNPNPHFWDKLEFKAYQNLFRKEIWYNRFHKTKKPLIAPIKVLFDKYEQFQTK